jgi:DNA-directed RNA polymerase specialized sigma24 family protein
VQYSKDGQPLKLTWEDVVEQFKNLIKFAAKQQTDKKVVNDNMVSAEDLYQEGMIKLYDCWQIWCVDKNKDMDEFGPIFRKSLFRHVRRGGREKFTYIDLEDAITNIEDTNGEDIIENMYRDHGMNVLREILETDVARMLLDELVDPSPRTLFEVWADKARREMLKSQGKRVNIPKDNTVRMKHIQRSLGISTKQYDSAMQEIRRCAPLALDM